MAGPRPVDPASPSPKTASQDSSEAPAAPAAAESKAKPDGFDLGGYAGANYTLGVGPADPVLPGAPVQRGQGEAAAVWTRRGAGTVRSFDVAVRGNVTANDSSTVPSGEVTAGLDTRDYRATAHLATLPGIGLPFASRLQLERKTDTGSAFRLGCGARLGYFNVNEAPATGWYRSERAPSNVLAVGGFANPTLETGKRLHLSMNHELGLDLFGRIMPSSEFQREFESGHGTWFPIDTAAGIGSIYLRGQTALTYDVDLGRRYLLRPGVSHEVSGELYDPTIAPELQRNAVAAGARLYTPMGLSVAAAAEVDMRPTRDKNFAALPSAVGTLDYSPSAQLRASGSLRVDGGGVGGIGGTLAWLPTRNVALYGAVQQNRDFGTLGMLGAQVGFGSGPQQARRPRRGNELTGSVDAQRPYLDGRYEDRRSHQVVNGELGAARLEQPVIGLTPSEVVALHAKVTTKRYSDTRALGDLKDLSYNDFVSRVRDLAAKDPSAALDAVNALLGSSGPFDYEFHPGDPVKFTPEEFWRRRQGVCAEYHIFAAQVLNAAGIEAVPVEIFAPGLAHVVTAVRDPVSGQWDIVEYGRRLHIGASSPEAAAAGYIPNYYKLILLEDDGGLPAVRAVFSSPQARGMRDTMRGLR